jgi:hypothetical protein
MSAALRQPHAPTEETLKMNPTESGLKYPQFTPGPLVDALAKLNSLYVETRFHRDAQRQLRNLFRGASIPKTDRLTLAIIGPTGSGKSTALQQSVSWLRAFNELSPDSPDPVSRTALSANTRPKEILAKLLVDGGDPLSASGPQHQLERRLAKLGPRFKPLGLALDELHHCFENKAPREVALMASTLKNIVNHVPRPIVVMGVASLDAFLDSSAELRMRFRHRVYLEDPLIQRLEDVKDLLDLLTAMAKVVPCAADCLLNTKELLVRLLFASGGRFGAIVDLVKTACLEGADDESPVVRLTDFSSAYKLSTSLTQRKVDADPFAMPYADVLQLAKQAAELAKQVQFGQAGQA